MGTYIPQQNSEKEVDKEFCLLGIIPGPGLSSQQTVWCHPYYRSETCAYCRQGNTDMTNMTK